MGRPYTLLSLTIDNVANIVKAVHEADGLESQISCFEHVVNTTAKKAVSINMVSYLLGRIRTKHQRGQC